MIYLKSSHAESFISLRRNNINFCLDLQQVLIQMFLYQLKVLAILYPMVYSYMLVCLRLIKALTRNVMRSFFFQNLRQSGLLVDILTWSNNDLIESLSTYSFLLTLDDRWSVAVIHSECR